jgi:AAHS family 4-hydroxybenzoate transporter-like MFS transporter
MATGKTMAIEVSETFDKRKVSAYQYMVVALCGLVLFIDGFDTMAMSYIMPLIAKDWGIPKAMMGTLFSSTLVGLMVGYLVLAPLSDKFGHRRVILISTFVFGLFTLLTVMSTNVTELLVLRFLTGLGLGAAAPGAIALTGEYSPKRLRASFVLAIYCGFSLGFVAAGAAAGVLLSRFGWQSMLWVGGVAPIVLSVVLFFALPESLAFLARREKDWDQLRAILRRIDPTLAADVKIAPVSSQGDSRRASITSLFKHGRTSGTLLLWGVFFLNLAAFYFMQSWLPTILGGLNYPMQQIVWMTSLSTVGGIAAAFVVGPSMDRIGPYVTIGVLYLCGAVFMAFTAASLSAAPWVLTIAVFFGGFCVSGGQKSVIALAAVFYPNEIRSTGLGWALGIGRFGGIAGPAVAGILFSANWLPAHLFYLTSLMMLCAAAAVFFMGHRYGDKAASRPAPAAQAGVRAARAGSK